MKSYFCIDLKSFYASVECVLRKKDPLKTNLVVADLTRKGAITLAVSPSLKKLGVKNRCRVFEIPKNIKYIKAHPRMKLYMEYAALIYGVYLKYFSKEDIHVYSIDEVFIDVTSYLKFYNLSQHKLAQKLLEAILNETKIPAACGIGTNLYLAKIALDFIAKKHPTSIGYLNEELYQKKYSNYKPLQDFWQIGKGIEKHLNKLNIYTFEDINNTNQKLLYQEFGVDAIYLIDHAKGIEPVTIKQIKEYKSKSKSISNSQILFSDYSYEDGLTVLKEMIDQNILKLIEKKLLATKIYLSIGYSSEGKVSSNIKINPTDSLSELKKNFIFLYEKIVDKKYYIRKISIGFTVKDKKYQTNSLFKEENNEEKLQLAIANIKNKYGTNKLLKGINFENKATAIKRSKLIGGHNAE